MAIAHTIEDIIVIGIQIETNGQLFYEAAAKKTSSKAMKALFNKLAKWEDRHCGLFTDMLARRIEKKTGKKPSKPLIVLTPELAAAAASHVFKAKTDIFALVEHCKTIADSLSMALTFEKDSVVLYSAMLQALGNKDDIAGVEAILHEELNHIAFIMKEMKKLR